MIAFRAFVAHTTDKSTSFDATMDHDRQKQFLAIKAAEFTLASDGECPWPPHEILGHRVAVVDVDTLLAILTLAALSLESVRTGRDDAAEGRMKDIKAILKRLWPDRPPPGHPRPPIHEYGERER